MQLFRTLSWSEILIGSGVKLATRGRDRLLHSRKNLHHFAVFGSMGFDGEETKAEHRSGESSFGLTDVRIIIQMKTDGA